MEMVDEYNSIQPDVKINAVFQGLYEEMEIKMLTAAVARQLPDVARKSSSTLIFTSMRGCSSRLIVSSAQATERTYSIKCGQL